MRILNHVRARGKGEGGKRESPLKEASSPGPSLGQKIGTPEGEGHFVWEVCCLLFSSMLWGVGANLLDCQDLRTHNLSGRGLTKLCGKMLMQCAIMACTIHLPLS